MGDLHFEGFPEGDASWRVRWVDYGSAGGLSGSSRLWIALSRLPDDLRVEALPDLSGGLACARAETVQVRVHVGWLPVLPIGTVLRAGRVLGRLGGEIRDFHFDHRSSIAFVQRLLAGSRGRANPVEQGRRFRAKTGFHDGFPPLPVLPDALADPLPGLVEGRALSIGPLGGGAPGPRLLVPCPEVLRVAYAPHSALARAILDGQWERTREMVVDTERTVVTAEGWTVATLAPLRSEHVAVAGNLCLNPVAARNANLVRAAIVARHDGPAYIDAPLPFEWTMLRLRVACFPVPSVPDLWFGYEILGLSWPDPPRGPPPEIDWLPLAAPSGVVDGSTPGSGRTGGPRTIPPSGDPTDVSHDRDSSPGVETDVVEPGASWFNLPVIVRRPPGGRPRPPRARRTPEPVGADSLSAGADARGPTGAASAAPQLDDSLASDEPACARFGSLLAMLDGMVANGSILGHEGVGPLAREAAFRGSVACWAFPPVSVLKSGSDDPRDNWFVRDFRREKPERRRVVRAAMVRRILHTDGMVYLVEIEPRPRASKPDSYKCLVFLLADSARLETVVTRLLRLAAERRGVWPVGDDLLGLTRIDGVRALASAGSWTHVRKPASDAPAAGLEVLDGSRALREIERVIADSAFDD